MLGISSVSLSIPPPISFYIHFSIFRVRRVGDKVSVILAKGPTEHISSVKSFSFVFAFDYCVFRHVCSLGGLFSHPCLGQLATVVMSAIHFRHRVIFARHCIPSPAHESRLAPWCAHRVLHKCTCLVFEGTGPWTVFTHPCWGRADSQQWCWFSKITSRPHL